MLGDDCDGEGGGDTEDNVCRSVGGNAVYVGGLGGGHDGVNGAVRSEYGAEWPWSCCVWREDVLLVICGWRDCELCRGEFRLERVRKAGGTLWAILDGCSY